MSFTFHEGEFDHEDVAALLELHFNAMRGASPPEACHVLPASSLEHPSIRLFSARDMAGTLLGVGALKTLDSTHGEIKSMRTAPAALGLGVGGKLLTHLIATARATGMTRLSLETGAPPISPVRFAFTSARDSPVQRHSAAILALSSQASSPGKSSAVLRPSSPFARGRATRRGYVASAAIAPITQGQFLRLELIARGEFRRPFT